MNNIIISGYIVRNVEKKELNEGAFVVNNVVAVRRFGTDKTDFINIKVFGKQVDNFCNIVKKGTRILIQGQLLVDTWKDKEDKTVISNYVLVANFEMLTSKADEEAETKKEETRTGNGVRQAQQEVNEEDLPF